MSRKTLITLLVILFAGILAFLIYFFFFRASVREERRTIERPELTSPFGVGLPSDGFDRRDDLEFQFEIDTESRIRQITASPVSGYNVFIKDTEDDMDETPGEDNYENIIKYVERATGHIYETTFDSLDNQRISNVTIPKNYYSLLLDEGQNIIYRFLSEDNPDTIKTYLSEFTYNTSEEPESEVFSTTNASGEFLMDGITQIIKSPGGRLFGFFTNKTNSGFNGVGFLFDHNDTANVNVILNSQISEWNPQWVTEESIALTTRTSYKSAGYSYLLDTNSGNLTRILGPLLGLNTNYSPDGKTILVSASDEEGTESFLYNISNQTVERTFSNTLAEKCTWDANSEWVFCASPSIIPPGAPDSWYQGLVTFNDTIISYEIATGDFRILNEYGNRNISLDIINLKISDDNTLLVFQNKRDLSLWAYDLRD